MYKYKKKIFKKFYFYTYKTNFYLLYVINVVKFFTKQYYSPSNLKLPHNNNNNNSDILTHNHLF